MNLLRWLIGIVGIIGAWKSCAWYFILRERHALRKERDAYRDPAAPRPRLSLAPSIHQLAERAHARRAEAQRVAHPTTSRSSQSARDAESRTDSRAMTPSELARGAMCDPHSLSAESGYIGTQLTWEGVILPKDERKERA